MSRLSVSPVRILLICLLSAFVDTVHASSGQHDMPADMPRPAQVHLVVRILDIVKVEEMSGVASVALEVQQRWHDAAQAFEPRDFGRNRLDYSGADAQTRLDAMWSPAVAIENLEDEAKRKLLALSVYSGGDIVLTERLEGRYRFSSDLSAFPFDRQTLPFRFVSQYFAADDVIFVVRDQDRKLSTVAEELNASDWRAGGVRFATEQFYGWSARPFARLVAEVDIDRKWPRYFLRIFVPFLAVLSVSIFILWAPSGLIGDKPGITYSALLALAALSFTFEASFPGSMSVTSPIAFMISIGYFYLILALLLDLFLRSEVLTEHTRYAYLSQEVRLAARYLMPVLFLLVCVCVTLRSLA